MRIRHHGILTRQTLTESKSMEPVESKPPRPGMIWSQKHRRWVDADTRTTEMRKRDENIVRLVEGDEGRVRELIRTAKGRGETSAAVDPASRRIAAEVIGSLIEARKRAGLAQAEVARRMGVPQPTVVRLEAGTHSPTLTTIARYARAVGVALKVCASG